jgi:hypothetical protein
MAKARTHVINFRANPTQLRFIQSRAEADLFDCRKGEGKSAALAWCVYHHTRENPGAEWLVIRDTWENCRRTTQREFFTWFAPGILGEYRAGDKEFIWTAEQIGLRGRVTFIGLDDERDAHKVASMPLAGFAMDEPAPAAGDSSGISEFVFDTAMAQLRQQGMSWYAAKLAQNNPDESHWTYRRFWDPGTPNLRPVDNRPPRQEPGFVAWQTGEPENAANLPAGYYEGLANLWAHRPDLLRRFVEGKHGFQQQGKAVTPEWTDELHLAHALEPVAGVPLQLLYDGGLNPTCVITQVTPLGDWLILEAHVGDGIGMYELIEDVVKPRLTTRFARWWKSRSRTAWRHIGDPSLDNREQSSSLNSAARVIRRELGGPFIKGPVAVEEGVDPLRAVLRRVREGRGIVRVDMDKAKPVWHALRGGWHYHVTRSGSIGMIEKDVHSHPGDAIRYGAAVLFPLGRLRSGTAHGAIAQAAYGFSGTRQRPRWVPDEAKVIR